MPSIEWFRSLKAVGYDLLIVGTQSEAITRNQLTKGQSVGLDLEAYVWLDWASQITTQIKDALNMVSGFPIRRLWLDVEQESGDTPENIVDRLLQVVATEQFPLGIYTSCSKWDKVTRNTTTLAGVPLWSAYYTKDDDIGNWGGPYGGWSHCAMRQHKGDVALNGVNVDMDVYEEI